MTACRHVESLCRPIRGRPLAVSRNYTTPAANSTAKSRFVPASGTYPRGFLVSGTHVGIKPSKGQAPDLALVTSDRQCSAAAVFTDNDVQAAPVTISKEVLKRRRGQGIRSIIVNSGCANAVTGKSGLQDANSMITAVNDLQSDPDSALVCSTGVIGQPLPIQRILGAVPMAKRNLDHSHEAWYVPYDTTTLLS